MKDRTTRERIVYGPAWDHVHGGYFSDPAVARPLVDAARKALRGARPDVVVDVGGGTGFVLRRLAARGVPAGVRLVNLDPSMRQLRADPSRRVSTLKGSLSTFRRPKGGHLMLIMRSALHYEGRRGLLPALRHLRGQMREGELFIHQTACFARADDARRLNTVYRLMGTRKWYPTVAALRRALRQTGWNVLSESAAPALTLTSTDLAKRYALDASRIARIRRSVSAKRGVFAAAGNGFTAHLHYRIFVCAAVKARRPRSTRAA